MYKKIRFYIRLFVAFTSKYFLLIILGMVLAGLTSILLPHVRILISHFRPTQKIGIIGYYTISNLPASVLDNVSQGLTTVNVNGIAIPGLASHWDISPDGKTFYFKLNPDIKWQNGKPLKSSDFKYQFRDAVFSYPDNASLAVNLSAPFAPLPILLSHPILKIFQSGPLHLIQFIGTGNYRISDYKTNGAQLVSLNLTPANINSALSNLKYLFYTSAQEAITAFKLGLVNKIKDISDPSDLSMWPNSEILPIVNNNQYVGVFFNTTDPQLSGQSGKDLRLALAYAIDKSVWKNRCLGPINPESWAYNPDIKSYDFDMVKARELLKKVEKVPQSLNLSTVPAYIDLAELIKKSWEKLNLKINITVSPEIPDNFQILLMAQAIPPDPDQYIYWHSTQNLTNLTNLSNPRIDKLLEDGRKTYDLSERKKIYFDFQKYLVEEIPVIFLYHPVSYTVNKI